MNNKTISGIVLLVIVLLGFGVMTVMNKDDKTTQTESTAGSSMMGRSNTQQQPSAGVQETNTIIYSNFEVAPDKIKVKKGTKVTWTNEDTAKHDVTPDNENDEFKASKLFGKGETYSVTFNTVGTYSYYCSPHPYMKGTIEVVE